MFTRALFVGALAACVAAQSGEVSSVLGFTRVPSPITAGTAEALTYRTNDTSSPVTIVLRKGNADDLKNVSTLTTSASNGQYIWTPSTTLENGNDYALEIIQGTQFNYFGPFAIQGAGMPSSSSASASASSSITAASNGTMPYMTGTAASAGTGTPIARNTTMLSATLSASGTSSSSSSYYAATNSAGFQATGSSGGAAASSTTNAAAAGMAAGGGSAVALLFGAIAAVLYV